MYTHYPYTVKSIFMLLCIMQPTSKDKFMNANFQKKIAKNKKKEIFGPINDDRHYGGVKYFPTHSLIIE